MTAIFAAISGMIAGVAVGWFLKSRHAAEAGQSVADELRRQLQTVSGELATVREQATAAARESSAAQAAKEAALEQLTQFRRQAENHTAHMAEVQTQLRQTSAEQSKLRAELDASANLLAERQTFHEKQMQEAQRTMDRALADLRESFKALSADALKASAPEFLRMAGQTFAQLQESSKGDLEKRQEAISGMLKPLEEQLKTYQQRLQQNESTQSTAIGEVRKQLETLTRQSESLANETERFRMVLKSNQARGRWGEETLRRVVEAAGMSAHCDFVEQAQQEDKKPDMVVRLPGDRLIIVDAKVPDLDFITALETADLEKRKTLLGLHATKLKETIKDLTRRDYPSQFPNALDYVILFLPAESLFSAALEGDRDLIVWAANNRVMLATPASLIALLRSVSISWQQFAQTENARDIAAAAQELFARVSTFTEHFEKIRNGLVRATDGYNAAVGSYERMIRPSGERLLKLGVNPGGKALTDPSSIATPLRILTDTPSLPLEIEAARPVLEQE
jgi:DNA recombination protein RmuC